jgi:hypothetical protein
MRETHDSDDAWTSRVNDHTNLIGGPAGNLRVGLTADLTVTSPTEPPIFEFISLRGTQACDPI